jgi:hypothetical protein
MARVADGQRQAYRMASKKKQKREVKNWVPADPTQWSEKSQGSVGAYFTKAYEDRLYKCRRCGKDSVFSAIDQKYTYEIKKAPIDQDRVLCAECWKESLAVTKALREHELKWRQYKPKLKQDAKFLGGWLELIQLSKEFSPYKANTAIENMIKRLIDENA